MPPTQAIPWKMPSASLASSSPVKTTSNRWLKKSSAKFRAARGEKLRNISSPRRRGLFRAFLKNCSRERAETFNTQHSMLKGAQFAYFLDVGSRAAGLNVFEI